RSFAGTRTVDLMGIAIRLGGFEIRDCLQWLYGSGFPKSLDVSKAIDKMAGAEREKIRVPASKVRKPKSIQGGHGIPGGDRPWMREALKRGYHELDGDVPVTPEAKQWKGRGTHLKPANEPIILARKPLSEPNVAANVLKWGTGALNIDGCRIPTGKMLGRFPANIILDEEAAAMLDGQSGIRQGGARPARRGPGTKGYHGWPNGTNDGVRIEYESGGASRFFYVAKASRSERTMGGKVENNHPTVKPIKLMRYLCRLITPPGGIILDPFAGSGTTLIATVQEGFNVIGIEREPEYCNIIRQRMAAVQQPLPLAK